MNGVERAVMGVSLIMIGFLVWFGATIAQMSTTWCITGFSPTLGIHNVAPVVFISVGVILCITGIFSDNRSVKKEEVQK